MGDSTKMLHCVQHDMKAPHDNEKLSVTYALIGCQGYSSAKDFAVLDSNLPKR